MKRKEVGGYYLPNDSAEDILKSMGSDRLMKFDPKNKTVRKVLSPMGIGTYWGNEDPQGNPVEFAVMLSNGGTKIFKADQLHELEFAQPKEEITVMNDKGISNQLNLF